MRKAIITGGSGFIGQHLVKACLDAGFETVVIVDITEPRSMPSGPVSLYLGNVSDVGWHPMAEGADVVFHLASMISVGESFDQPWAYMSNNVCSTLSVIRCAKRNSIPSIVFASSAAVYAGLDEGVPSREDSPTDPQNPYGLSKLASEKMGQFYASDGLSFASMRFFNVYGPGQKAHGSYASVIPKFAHAAANGQPMTVYGGHQVRDFVHVSDVASALVVAAKCRLNGTFNVGTGMGHNILGVAKAIQRASPSTNINVVPQRPGDVNYSVASVFKLISKGWSPKHSLSSYNFGPIVESYRQP